MNNRVIMYYFFRLSGLVGLLSLFKLNKPVILCYHRISNSKFNEHISVLKSKFEIVPLDKLLAQIYSDNKLKIVQSISITMDDCYLNDFHNAYNVCNKHCVHCTYFVPTGYSSSEKSIWPLRLITFLQNLKLPIILTDFKGVRVTLLNSKDLINFERTWIDYFLFNDIKTQDIEMLFDCFFKSNNSIDFSDPVISGKIISQYRNNRFTSFQSHTVFHEKLYLLDKKQINKELHNAKLYLERLIDNYPQNVFCYPYGSEKHIGNSFEQVSKYFKFAVTLQSGVLSKENCVYKIPRIGIYEHDDYHTIMLKVIFAQLKYCFNKIRKIYKYE